MNIISLWNNRILNWSERCSDIRPFQWFKLNYGLNSHWWESSGLMSLHRIQQILHFYIYESKSNHVDNKLILDPLWKFLYTFILTYFLVLFCAPHALHRRTSSFSTVDFYPKIRLGFACAIFTHQQTIINHTLIP